MYISLIKNSEICYLQSATLSKACINIYKWVIVKIFLPFFYNCSNNIKVNMNKGWLLLKSKNF
jgi:hypothetical protein